MRMNARAIQRVAPVRPDDRWRAGERGARLPAVAVAILVGSLALHVAVLAFALLGTAADAVVPQEIPVEIVQAPPDEAAKPPKPAPPPQPPLRPAGAPDPAQEQRAGLERELAALKAEQASLNADDRGLGPLRDSIRAVALPSPTSTGDGDDVSYQSLVFSQLARAKEGVISKAAGTVGIRFSVDETGGLVEVAVARSSGSKSLDDEAMAVVRRAAPFPKPPAGAERAFSANVSSSVAR